jgi:hypothetical protein
MTDLVIGIIILVVASFIIGFPIMLIWAIFSPKEKREHQPIVNVNVPQPYQPPVQRAITPGGSDNWVQHALRNPEVTLQVVEKYEVQNGQFTAEKHMRMTGPVEAAPGQRQLICIMPGPRKKNFQM